MTTPLPPLPEWTQVWLNEYQKASLREYAKLAVREALERAAKACERDLVNRRDDPPANYFDGGLRHCADAISAMVEEYK